MNDFDDLDDLLGELRSAATDAELAGETSHLDAMARHHRRQKGHTMITSRRARVATFVAAGVIGFGGVAAAGPGGPFALTGSDDTTTTSEVTTTTSEVTTTTSEAPTTTSEVTTTTSEVVLEDDSPITRSVIEQVTDDATLVGDPDTDSDGPCFGLDPAQFDNHGEFVSAVARGDVELPEGIEQRDAAQSSCGKDDDVEAADEVDEVKDDDDDGDDGDDRDSDDSDDHDGDDGDDDSDDDDSDDDRPEKSGKPDKPGKPESAGKQGNGSKKSSDD